MWILQNTGLEKVFVVSMIVGGLFHLLNTILRVRFHSVFFSELFIAFESKYNKYNNAKNAAYK